jgi:DHA2 family multidrug resistance protein
MSQLPLISQAVVGLEPKDYASGISLNNMIRQLGGAFGIAIANNYVAGQYAIHRAALVSNMPEGSTVLNERIQQISQGITQRSGDAAMATQKAYAIINGTVDRQAYYLSYLDTFRLVGIFFLVVIPLVVFLRVKKDKKQDPKEMMKAAAEAH